MRYNYDYGYDDGCTATMTSMTQALRAQQVLANAAIHSSVIKLDSSHAKKGCAYGLSFQCAQYNNVRTILSSAKINVRQYINADSKL